MPLLDKTGLIPDAWTKADDAAATTATHLIVAPDALDDALLRNELHLGVILPNTASVESLAHVLERLELIAIAFPVYSDGRGFSLAKRLRRAGFKGRLRASGPLIADQFAYALACGFDEIDLAESVAARQPVAQWLKAASAFSENYQRGYGTKGSILDQRRAAALAGGNHG